MHRKPAKYNDYKDYDEDDIIDESEFDSNDHHTDGMSDNAGFVVDEEEIGVELVALSGSGSALMVQSLPYSDHGACRKRCCIGLMFVTMALAFAYAVVNYPLFGDGSIENGENNGGDEQQQQQQEPMGPSAGKEGGMEGDWEDADAGGYIDIDIDEVDNMGGEGGEAEEDVVADMTVKAIPHATLQDGIRFEVLEQLPHDPNSFTQGLSYDNGILYESIGLYGESKVRRLDATTMEVLQSIDMPKDYFAEGLAYHNGKLIQITWKENTGFVYDANDLTVLLDFPFESTKNEGWGITHDKANNRFIMSDGSPYLHFWDDETLEDMGNKVKVVRMNGKAANNLNELEFWRGRVLANVWFEDTILVINPENGVVESEYDFSALWPKSERKQEHADVLNGISISDQEDALFVTGKLWKYMFKIRLIEE